MVLFPCSTLGETMGALSPSIQTQHKVFFKLHWLLASLFEAETLQAKNITQLLIVLVNKLRAVLSQFLITAVLAAARVVISSTSKLIPSIRLILTLSVRSTVRLQFFSQSRHCLKHIYFKAENSEIQRTVWKCFSGRYPYRYYPGKSEINTWV